MQVDFEMLSDANLDEVLKIETASFSMPWSREDFKHLIEDDKSIYLVILADGIVAGCAGYTFNGFDGYVNNVVIDEKYRGLGLGKKLMQEVISEGHKAGVTEFTLEVRVSNKTAISLYEALGFTNEGVRKRFYEHPVEDAYVMWLRG